MKPSIVKARILAPSEYLIIHIVRFFFDHATQVPSKREDPVIFDFENLNLTSHLAKYIRKDGVEAIYDLYGIVCHIGLGIDEGHYVAYAKLGDQQSECNVH